MPRHRPAFACAAVLLAFTGSVLGQVVTTPVYIADNLPSSGNCNVIPFGSFSPPGAFTYIGRIPASYLLAAAPVVHEIAFAPCASGTFQCATIQMGLGHVPNPLPATFAYPTFDSTGNITSLGNFVNYTPIWNSVAQGPFSWPYAQNAWSPMGFAALGGTAFAWDGINDIAFYVTWSGATGLNAFHYSGTEPLRRYNTGVYQAAASNGADSAGLKMRLDLRSNGPPVYQVNSSGASFDLNGVLCGGSLPAVVNVTADNICTFGTVTANWSSTFTGVPWSLGITAAPLVALGSGGFSTQNNICNLDLGDPSLVFIDVAAPLFPAAFPYTPPIVPLSASAQMVVLDGNTSPDGFRLSQGTRYSVTAQTSTSVVGPTGDDSFNIYTLGQGGLCATGPSMQFYGVTYTQVAVTTNGRIMWAGADAIYTPTVAGAMANPGFIGAWSDLYVGLPTGVVNITTPTYGIFRADWVGVPYFPGTGSTTFGIQFDSTTGFMQIDGLTFSTPGNNMMIGTSRGAGATDPGMTNYLSFIGLGLQSAPAGTGMIYRLGSGGTLTTGCAMLLFAPNGSGNYNFAVF